MLRVGVLPRATWALARTSLTLLTWTSLAHRASSSGLASAAGAASLTFVQSAFPASKTARRRCRGWSSRSSLAMSFAAVCDSAAPTFTA